MDDEILICVISKPSRAGLGVQPSNAVAIAITGTMG